MNGVLDIAGTNYEIKYGCAVWAKRAIAPINWQSRFKVRTYTHEVLGLLSSDFSSLVAVLAWGVSSGCGYGGVYITQFGTSFLLPASKDIIIHSIRALLPRINDDNSGILHSEIKERLFLKT